MIRKILDSRKCQNGVLIALVAIIFSLGCCMSYLHAISPKKVLVIVDNDEKFIAQGGVRCRFGTCYFTDQFGKGHVSDNFQYYYEEEEW